jgi:hypothetical protein
MFAAKVLPCRAFPGISVKCAMNIRIRMESEIRNCQATAFVVRQDFYG